MPEVELPAAFAELGVEESFLKALARIGIHTPSEIQAAMIPQVLAGHDVVGQARTGTGKTIAFALPMLQRIDPQAGVQMLCLVPTRELCTQVVEEVRRVGHFAKPRTVAIYGGSSVKTQLKSLERKPHFVVGTPGRIMDFLDRGALNLSELRAVVLDEVDRMLDIGFREDIRKILGRMRHKHQTIFVSATIDDEIRRLIAKYTHSPVEINVSRDEITVDEVEQSYVTVDRHDKFAVLKLLLEQEKPGLAIIFTNTKGGARRLAERLNKAGYKAADIHGDLIQRKRERVMARFRAADIHLLVATDLAARGIDVNDITHIVNYDLPEDSEVYVHRIGRTARMGSSGTAIALVTREEGKQLTAIEKLINREIVQRIVPGFTASPGREAVIPALPSLGDDFPPPATPEPAAATTIAKPRTLGGRFRPIRGRRRL